MKTVAPAKASRTDGCWGGGEGFLKKKSGGGGGGERKGGGEFFFSFVEREGEVGRKRAAGTSWGAHFCRRRKATGSSAFSAFPPFGRARLERKKRTTSLFPYEKNSKKERKRKTSSSPACPRRPAACRPRLRRPPRPRPWRRRAASRLRRAYPAGTGSGRTRSVRPGATRRGGTLGRARRGSWWL